MLIRCWLLLAIAAALSAAAGCGDRKERVVVYEERQGPVYVEDRDYDDDDYEYDDDDYDDDDIEVHIHRSHVCTRDCYHHYYNGSRIVVLRGHRHGPGCGHVWDGRYWVVGPRRVIRTGHVCTRGCNNHYWDGVRYIDLRGHRHGPGCGHYWNGNYWIVRSGPVAGPRGVIRTGHVCTRGCNHHYWDGARYINLRGHRHGPGCGHQWNGRYWIVGRTTKTIVPKRGRRIR